MLKIAILRMYCYATGEETGSTKLGAFCYRIGV